MDGAKKLAAAVVMDAIGTFEGIAPEALADFERIELPSMAARYRECMREMNDAHVAGKRSEPPSTSDGIREMRKLLSERRRKLWDQFGDAWMDREWIRSGDGAVFAAAAGIDHDALVQASFPNAEDGRWDKQRAEDAQARMAYQAEVARRQAVA